MSSDAVWTVGDNGDVAKNAVTAACDRWPIQRAAEAAAPDWYDAEVGVRVASAAVGLVAPPHTPVESKACRTSYGDRRGRWWISQGNHERLLEAGGLYALAVYAPDSGAVVAQTLLPAAIVDGMVDGNWWNAGAGGKGVDAYVQVPWSAVFEAWEVLSDG